MDEELKSEDISVYQKSAVPYQPTCPLDAPYQTETQKTIENMDDIAAQLDPDISDVNNPQNWSAWRKRTVLLALMTSSILCDGGMTWGASLFVAQAAQWNLYISRTSTPINYISIQLFQLARLPLPFPRPWTDHNIVAQFVPWGIF
jgi:hypothetical protein